MTIWRLTINPAANEDVDPKRFCIDRNILGVGWPVDTIGPLDWDTYYALAAERYYNEDNRGWLPAVNAIHNRMEVDDLCWTRDLNGNYYLGKVDGDWEYQSTDDHLNADVVNVRACTWVRTGGVDSVPGKVLNSFRARRALQAVHDETIHFYSQLFYNQVSGNNYYDLINEQELDLFALISSEDCEDIVGIYLQEEYDYRLIPSSCKLDTVRTEFVLRKVGSKAQVQVKQGDVPLNRNEFEYNPDDPSEWFLFTTCGQYDGDENDYVQCITPDEIRDFAYNNTELMPDRIRRLIEFCNEII